MIDPLIALQKHQKQLLACTRCPQMIGPVVIGEAVQSRVLLLGQAPGIKEGDFGKPFAWTAGKTLFKWFNSIGLEEQAFRQRIYMSAVCRCFPGKNPKGGDRVPNKQEIKHCAEWMNTEMSLLNPQLVIPVGKLAISQLIQVDTLKDIIGQSHTLTHNTIEYDMIPLPHPSGASTWHRTEPGKTLLQSALQQIKAHPAWQSVCHSANKL